MLHRILLIQNFSALSQRLLFACWKAFAVRCFCEDITHHAKLTSFLFCASTPLLRIFLGVKCVCLFSHDICYPLLWRWMHEWSSKVIAKWTNFVNGKTWESLLCRGRRAGGRKSSQLKASMSTNAIAIARRCEGESVGCFTSWKIFPQFVRR